MNCPCLECPAAAALQKRPATEIRRADFDAARAEAIADAAAQIAANLAWGKDGPPWAKGAAALADRRADAAAIVERWGAKAGDDLREAVAAIRAGGNPERIGPEAHNDA